MLRQVLLVAFDGKELRNSFPQPSRQARPGGSEFGSDSAGIDAERGKIEWTWSPIATPPRGFLPRSRLGGRRRTAGSGSGSRSRDRLPT
jgi:hypothetical protein